METNNQNNIPNYYACKGTSLTFAPRILNIVPLKIKLNIPKIIRVKKILYIDYKDKTTLEILGDSIFRKMNYPVWITDSIDDGNNGPMLRAMLVPNNRTDEIIEKIENIPAKIEVFYGKTGKEQYEECVNDKMSRIYGQ